MEQEQRLWELLAMQHSGELNELELEELERLKNVFPDAVKQFNILNTLSFNAEKLSARRKEQLMDGILMAAGDAEIEAPPGKPRKGTLIALLLIVLAIGPAVGWWLISARRSGSGQQEWSTIQVRKGSRSKVTLPDGTVVFLNAGSTLSYPNDFTNAVREVKLSGEGYFKVVTMAEHPFVVYTPALDISVLGTEFNVRAYQDEQQTEAVLISGKVEVILKDKEQRRFTLSPQQKVLVSNEIRETTAADTVMKLKPAAKPLIAVEKVLQDAKDSSFVETAWVENKFAFRNESFEVLAQRMERWYDVVIEFKNDALRSTNFTGSVDNESLPELLKILQETKRFNYTISSNKVIFY